MGTEAYETSGTYKIRISENDLRNIDEITEYIAFVNHQPLNAVRAGYTIFKAIGKIGRNPYVYKECSNIPAKSKIYRQKLCLS